MRQDYGERRFVVIGEFQGIVLTVVWTPRGNRRRIISVWRASSNRERRE
ncbi:MAG TPA: BrnT family toxin [Chloroflexota bacterium]